jgi:hypothetical protein
MGNSNRPQKCNNSCGRIYNPKVDKLHINYSRPLERDRKGFILSECDSYTRAGLNYVNKFEMSPPVYQSDENDISNSYLETDTNSVLDDGLDDALIYYEDSFNSDVLEENRSFASSFETTVSANSVQNLKSKRNLQTQTQSNQVKCAAATVRREQSANEKLRKPNTKPKRQNNRIISVVKNAIDSLSAPPEWLERNFTYYNNS